MNQNYRERKNYSVKKRPYYHCESFLHVMTWMSNRQLAMVEHCL